MHPIRWLALGAAVLALQGCAALIAPPYSANYEVLDALKRTPLEKLAVAPVQPRDAAAPVNKITLRGARMESSKGSYAEYVEAALIQDLSELGVYDAKAAIRIDAVVLKNELDVSGLSTGTGSMEVDVAVVAGGAPRHRKTYRADIAFESSFAGAVAIPRGQIEYPNLVKALLAKLYADPEFINAIKRK